MSEQTKNWNEKVLTYLEDWYLNSIGELPQSYKVLNFNEKVLFVLKILAER